MGERVRISLQRSHLQRLFPSAVGKGPGVVVIQEWWGLVPHIEDLVDRFARKDSWRSRPISTTARPRPRPTTPGKMLMELDVERAAKEIAGAGQYLLQRPECTSKTFGVVGFCMGGALAQYAATFDAKNVGAAVSFYGGFKKVSPDWEKLESAAASPLRRERQGRARPSGRELEQKLRELGKNVEVVVYPTPTTRSSTTRVPRSTTPRPRRTRGGARWICSGASL